jgi:hypothetical protein
MLRVTLICALLLTAFSNVRAFPEYGWTLSASPTDPLVNSIPATTEITPVYLWFYCSTQADGISGARFVLDYSPQVTIFSFVPSSGVVNSGTIDEPVLAISGCPQGSFLAGRYLLQAPSSGNISICLGPPGIPPGANVSYGCTNPDQPF